MFYIDEAARRTTERNLDASKRYKDRAAPSIQTIMSPSSATRSPPVHSQRKQAIATQQQAATGFAGLGTGRRFG